jgi:hypothetical protein
MVPKDRMASLIRRLRRLADFMGKRKTLPEKQDSANF